MTVLQFLICLLHQALGGFQWPDVPLKMASICSRVLPFVSGMKAMVKMTLMRHKEENNQKVPALVRRFWKRGQLCRDAGLCWKGNSHWAVSYGLLINDHIFKKNCVLLVATSYKWKKGDAETRYTASDVIVITQRVTTAVQNHMGDRQVRR